VRTDISIPHLLCAGGNKGIGYEIVRKLASDPNLTVLLGSRDLSRGEEAAQKLGLQNVRPIGIDIDSQNSITEAAEKVKKDFGGLDILCNNAGMAFKGDRFDSHVVERTLRTNYYGTLNAIRTFLPIIRENGKIVNVSSTSSISALGKLSPENRKRFFDPKLTIDGVRRNKTKGKRKENERSKL
jgi:carbonyl reductase 1